LAKAEALYACANRFEHAPRAEIAPIGAFGESTIARPTRSQFILDDFDAFSIMGPTSTKLLLYITKNNNNIARNAVPLAAEL
jgi:hypothetical protein